MIDSVTQWSIQQSVFMTLPKRKTSLVGYHLLEKQLNVEVICTARNYIFTIIMSDLC